MSKGIRNDEESSLGTWMLFEYLSVRSLFYVNFFLFLYKMIMTKWFLPINNKEKKQSRTEEECTGNDSSVCPFEYFLKSVYLNNNKYHPNLFHSKFWIINCNVPSKNSLYKIYTKLF